MPEPDSAPIQPLPEEAFRKLIEIAPLVAVDLVVSDGKGRILLGRRVNEPARGLLFVPGGRIYKGESLDDAFRRISTSELGAVGYERPTRPRVLGVYTHVYDTNALGIPGVSTHYVVIACHLEATEELQLPSEQHSETRWVSPAELADAEVRLQVHPYARAYFDLPLGMTKRQYYALNARRDSANTLVWQAPVVGLTGIAFLFTVLLAGDTSRVGRIIAAALAVVVCAASWQLTAKQRHTETRLAIMAEDYERSTGMYELNRHLVPSRFPDEREAKGRCRGKLRNWANRKLLAESSVRLWQVLYTVIAVAAVVAAVVLS